MFKLKRKNDENTNENIEISAEEEMKVEEKTPKVETSDETTQTVSVLSVDDNAIKKEKKSKSGEKNEEKKVIKWGPNRILQCFAYFSVALIAIAMILRLIFKNQPDIAIYMQGVGECLAYIVCIWLGFYFTRKRGSIWWLIGWIIASVILVIFYIFAIV